ncbi:(d)CMP kinase [Sporosarcina thermotolerans]|uniref:Cytidylate kinase n=1 Tax=Sporosarcina thermotolerans TaxID=633404 RepID=A0AAW9A768_9BACL|nr:(d)CMP kinase [Sporosarcina thermotolerans]MDW0115573.1 (d)CMP kinase [Sporosarcina thermotolerans]WHT47128.1 (d)CMP kinase [Sporosarcina thermotolerans]
MSKGIIIAIDGPAAAGKSTIAKRIAQKLGYTYIDTGAMYRALTHKAIQSNINMGSDKDLADLLKHTEIVLVPEENGQAVWIDGVDCSEEIRSQEVTANVSEVAAHSTVRHLMVEKQRELAEGTGVVMDGRDIGTAVLPKAELKVFMTASVDERAERRFVENEKRGIHIPLAQLKEEIEKRDRADSERELSPLKMADDAILVDTTSMSIEEVANQVIMLAEKRMNQ